MAGFELSTEALKDKIAIAFSSAALAISPGTFYFTNLRVENRLQARLVNFEIRAGNTEDNVRRYINGFIVGRFVIVNAGNRPAMILGVQYKLNETGRHEDGGFGNEVDSGEKPFPLLVQPRDLRILDLAIPIRNMVENFENGGPSGDSDTRLFFASYLITSLDANGKSFEVTSPFLAKIEVERAGWRALAPLANTTFAAIELLAKR